MKPLSRSQQIAEVGSNNHDNSTPGCFKLIILGPTTIIPNGDELLAIEVQNKTCPYNFGISESTLSLPFKQSFEKQLVQQRGIAGERS